MVPPLSLPLVLALSSLASTLAACQAGEEEHDGQLHLLQTEMHLSEHLSEADLTVDKMSMLNKEQSAGGREEAAVQENLSAAPWSFYHYTLMVLLVVSVVVSWYTRPKLDSLADEWVATGDRFKNHRFKFLVAWGVAASADWLQGPYVYALYDSFGYSPSEINKLFVVGFLSSMVFGTFVGSLADSWGRKRTALLYCVLYIVSCLTKHCSLYLVLMFGRVTGGIATSLLFSSFECWMVGEHNERQHFSGALLRYMFSLMYYVNYLAAIFSGIVAQAFVDAVPMRRIIGYDSLHYGGNLCPFDLAIVMLCMAFFVISTSWEENYGDAESKQTILESFQAAVQVMTTSWRIGIIALVVGFFEGGMYAFVINWTPTLDIEGAPTLPHGLVFSAMMICCMMGSSAFSYVSPRVNPAKVVLLCCAISTASFGVVVLVCGQAAFAPVLYGAFLCFEWCVGLYMPSIGALKSDVVPEAARAGVYNCFRVPLNIVVCSVILSNLSMRRAFAVCATLVAIAAVALVPLAREPLSQKLAKTEGVDKADAS